MVFFSLSLCRKSNGNSAPPRSKTRTAACCSSRPTAKSRLWSPLATNVVVSKYFYGEPGTPERENQRAAGDHRVARTIADWGIEDGYFATAEGRRAVLPRTGLALPAPARGVQLAGLVQRRPVPPVRRDRLAGNYTGTSRPGSDPPPENPYEYPQGSACFIQSVDDNMEDIMRLATSEAMLFKFGSGTGTDLSTIRSAPREALRRRHSLRAAVVHAGVRPDRRRGEVGRQDPPRRQDAVAQGLASRHPRVHPVQGERRAKARTLIEKRRVRSQLQRRGLQLVDHVPERQPLGPRQRRVHAGGGGRDEVDRPAGSPTGTSPAPSTKPAN
jgi:ribonucleoside-diphosphate reductase alpha chain